MLCGGGSTKPALPESRPTGRAARRRPAGQANPRREGQADDERLACHTTLGHTAVRLVERGFARRRAQRPVDNVPLVHRHGSIVRRRTARTHLLGHKRRGPGKEHRTEAQRQGGQIPGSFVLDPDNKHIPRPALGARPRVVWRRPIHELKDGPGRGARTARARGPQIPQAACLRQTLRCTQRPGKDQAQPRH